MAGNLMEFCSAAAGQVEKVGVRIVAFPADAGEEFGVGGILLEKVVEC